MAVVKVPLGTRSYSIYVEPGRLDRLGELLARRYDTRRCALVSSPRVFRLHGRKARASLARAGWSVETLLVPDGERAKTPAQVAALHKRLAETGLERKHPIVVMAGGTLGDMAGFAAATYLRGVPLVHVPTTLMAQVDSAVGGKTGVNLPQGKNLVGAFWQPGFVLCDPRMLSTLPEREFRSGLAEIIKYGCIASPKLLARVRASLSRGALPDAQELSKWIVECVRIKSRVVSLDEHEGGLRRVLNFGHTYGHALEKTEGFGKLLHGEAVALGLVVALDLSRRTSGLNPVTEGAIVEMLKYCFPRLKFPRVPWSRISRALGADKKTTSGRNVWIVITEPGSPGVFMPTEADVRRSIERARHVWA